MSRRRFVGAGFAAACALLVAVTSAVVAVPAAHAEVEPGGWRSVSPGFRVQQRGCGQVSGLTFRLTCQNTSGDQRAERRYDTYTGGSRQFEGFFRVTGGDGYRISLKQTFRSGPYFILAVDRGGRLYQVGGPTIQNGVATTGTRVRVNTVHVVGSHHRTYINGSRRQEIGSAGGSFYDKFGAYRTNSGRGTITVEWSDIRFWVK